MNATALTNNPETDYRTAMQQAAVVFLLRHRGEHLTGDSQVLKNCTRYLAQSLEVPTDLAPRIAELAVAEFEGWTTNRLTLLGMYLGSGHLRPVLYLLDNRTQQHHLVPARYLPARLLNPRNTSK
ncbi:hypothetical protein [Pseudomonas fulva]|uniref:hypothetical protein n=1 Tax=Pseudomonas fulva TaxID=47880 RepID=UPI000D903F10|nr:hypothetical protein [Pseudomonas fulva]PYB93562.1 hypothetical protein DMX01_03265 [Pseudomonas fulva]PYC16387.1 hypothetical protein DMX00_04855 [Pseudomonas fulva]